MSGNGSFWIESIMLWNLMGLMTALTSLKHQALVLTRGTVLLVFILWFCALIDACSSDKQMACRLGSGLGRQIEGMTDRQSQRYMHTIV